MMPNRAARTVREAPWYFNAAGVFLLTLGIVSVVIMYLSLLEDRAQAEEFRDYVACNAQWQDEWTAAQLDRAAASEQDRMLDRRAEQNITDLIAGISAASGDRPTIVAAFEDWEERTASIASQRFEVEQEREATPLPDPPAEVCGVPDNG